MCRTHAFSNNRADLDQLSCVLLLQHSMCPVLYWYDAWCRYVGGGYTCPLHRKVDGDLARSARLQRVNGREDGRPELWAGIHITNAHAGKEGMSSRRFEAHGASYTYTLNYSISQLFLTSPSPFPTSGHTTPRRTARRHGDTATINYSRCSVPKGADNSIYFTTPF